ncbi:hypothetical protein [Umezawaea sp. Da 62-37]|uniref:hypothetical protein n=1 Tax=Umezawaea sp. Da 62-37 TaxID=3075927 RepID=UPI0028F716BB|nr:hypothetical protein [Umezawaea sp. Da 62-37]WNV88421.1 hypothetical protein RM788_09035 [Umezawaea sp. Da 62-37]
MFYGALLGCARKIRFGHFSDAQLTTVAGVCADVVTDTGRSDDAPVLAAELLRRMSFGRVPTAITRLGHAEAVRRLTPGGRLVPPRIAAEICDRVVGGDDPILPRLVYGIGIAGEEELLRSLREEESMPEVVRTASLWWRGRGGR